MLEHKSTNLMSLSGASLLIEAKVNPAVDPCVVYVVSDFLQLVVM